MTSVERQADSVPRVGYPLALGHVAILALDIRLSTVDGLPPPQAGLGPPGASGGFGVSRGQVLRPNGT